LASSLPNSPVAVRRITGQSSITSSNLGKSTPAPLRATCGGGNWYRRIFGHFGPLLVFSAVLGIIVENDVSLARACFALADSQFGNAVRDRLRFVVQEDHDRKLLANRRLRRRVQDQARIPSRLSRFSPIQERMSRTICAKRGVSRHSKSPRTFVASVTKSLSSPALRSRGPMQSGRHCPSGERKAHSALAGTPTRRRLRCCKPDRPHCSGLSLPRMSNSNRTRSFFIEQLLNQPPPSL
jgi:hypothetical protein